MKTETANDAGFVPEVIAPQATLLSNQHETRVVSREQLATILPPEGTKSFKPVSHYELVQTLTGVLDARGIVITREQFALRHDGSRMFGTFDLSLNGFPASCASMGFRTANDKSMALQVIAGMRIFVCDNLCFNGDLVALKRKHTSGLELASEIVTAVDRYQEHYGKLVGNVRQLQDRVIDDVRAKSMIYDLVFAQKALPLRLAANVGEEYFNPRHAEFEPRTAWSLHNAFTEVVKQISGRDGNDALPLQLKANQTIGTYFGLLGNGTNA